jgi:hypothetical protein
MGTTPSKGKHASEGVAPEDEAASASRPVEGTEGTAVFQAGGHGKLSKDPGQEGAIRKVANEAEVVFYQTLNGDDPQLVTIPDHIRSFFPKFYGVSDKKYIVLQDLTHGVKRACVMDIKMGTKTFTSDSNVLKQWMLEHKDHKTTTSTLGFRVTGFRSFKRPSNEYDVKGKPWGMALTPEDITENLVTFFHDGEKVRTDVIKKYIDRLEVLFPWYSEQNIIKIYSSSLLFVYDSEGDVSLADVHMIDFAHVKRIEDPNGRDHGYIAGLRNLIDIFKQMLQNHPSFNAAETSQPSSSFNHLEIPEDRPSKKKRRKSQSQPSNAEPSDANPSNNEEKAKTPSKPPRSPRANSTSQPKSPRKTESPLPLPSEHAEPQSKRKSGKRPKTARETPSAVERTEPNESAALANSE